MWGLFAGSVLLGALFLFVPGFLLLRAFRLPILTAVVCAPLVSIPAYIAICLLNAKMGVFSSWLTLFVPLFLVGVVAFAIGSLACRGKEIRLGVAFSPDGSPQGVWGSRWYLDWAVLGLYATVGLVVASLCFAVILDGPDSFVQAYDNVHHLGVTHSFVESGNWSPFSAALYTTASDNAINPLPGSGFYPTAWNCMTALLVSSLGISTMMAANAVNFLFIALVFPTNMFVLMRIVFPEAPGVVTFGSLCTLGFSAFPWMLVSFGPLYPNLIALCMVPSLVFCFISLFSCGVGRAARAAAGVLFCLGVLCCAFTQPNAVFTAAVFLIPFCVRQAVRSVNLLPVPPERRRVVQIAAGCAMGVLVALVWYLLYKAPFLQSVVSHSWPAVTSKPQAIMDALSLGFRTEAMQFVLAIIVAVGGLYAVFRREYLWLACSYALMAFLYVVDVSSDGPLQHLLTGFWYTDSFRVAASVALFAIPLASLGLWVTFRTCCRLVYKAMRRDSPRTKALIACAVSSVFLLACFGPALINAGRQPKGDALDATLFSLRSENSSSVEHVYSADELAFVRKVQQTVPSGELILNVPDDGSAFAYGVNGLRVYYRYLRTYGESDEAENSRLIRNHLSEFSESERVRAAVAEVGGSYLLVLDQGDSKFESPRLFTYENGKNWKGVESITDQTPGFEVVLSEGDMRLYKIAG